METFVLKHQAQSHPFLRSLSQEWRLDSLVIVGPV